MLKIRSVGGVGAARGAGAESRHPVLTARWLREAVDAHRLAFEKEMRRERRLVLDRRFETFWKEMSARQA